MLTPNLDTIRLFIHVLAASIWVGGQFVLAGLVPGLRPHGPDVVKAAANGFARLAWPAFIVAFATGLWNILAVDRMNDTAWAITVGVKVLIVVAAGGSAAAHSLTENRTILAITGATGALFSIAALFLGLLLIAHS